MACACFSVTFEKLAEPIAVSAQRLAYPFAVTWERFCGTMIDLVAFSASDGMFLTREGYTILVKI